MKTLKFNSKRAQAFVNAYERSKYSRIEQVYKTCSYAKTRAQQWCLDTMKSEFGYSFRILSWNTFQFTVGWITDKGLRIKTANNSYLIQLPF